MKNLYDNPLYLEDLRTAAAAGLPWERLRDKAILISGATGLIGSFLIDVLVEVSRSWELNLRIYALGRSEEKARARFSECWDRLVFLPYDVNLPFVRDELGKTDFVIHLASNTHPLAYANDPIGTVMTNIIGTGNMLDFAVRHGAERCVFASSVEVYGENRGDTELFDEGYCGYIDCNSLRAGYPESKRCGEALCQAYIRQKGLDIVIPRFARVYGPTMQKSDSKAIAQFIGKAVAGEDIVLKSEGTQYYSFLYVSDAVTGLLTALLKGACGEAYNVSDAASDIWLRDLACLIAREAGKAIVFDLPSETERAGYSKATKARLDSGKLQALGWRANYSIASGVSRTIGILKQL